jgi:hypothetical protein
MTDNAWIAVIAGAVGFVIGEFVWDWRQARRTVEPDINEEWFALLDKEDAA